MKPTLNPEDAPVGICDACGAGCTGVLRDLGIGPYEYWGSKGTHHDWNVVSPCCDAPVVKGGETLKSQTTHVARTDHTDGRVKKGDKYLRLVYHRWRENGPGWYVIIKKVLEHGIV